MPSQNFKELFSYLNEKINNGDELSFKYTTDFCNGRGIKPERVIDWLKENGAGNDIEVLYNVEEKFENL